MRRIEETEHKFRDLEADSRRLEWIVRLGDWAVRHDSFVVGLGT